LPCCRTPARLSFKPVAALVVGVGMLGLARAGQEVRTGMVILIAVLSLPAITPNMTGWLTSLVPLPVFYYLICLGKRQGSVLVRNAILLAGGITLIFGSLPPLFFSLTLVPLGFVFYHAARQKTPPARTGFNGILVLSGIWLLFWTGIGIIEHINPYQQLLVALDQGLSRAFDLYQEESGLPAATLKNIEVAVAQLKTYIPKVLPGLLFSGILYTVWMNQALGNWLLKKRNRDLAPWQDFKEWQLPDYLVWGLILGAGSLFFLPGPLNTIGLNIVIVWGALYFLQGLAVLVSLLQRWSLPKPVRLLIYAFFVLQSVGVVLLSIIGLADVWTDFRKLNPPAEAPS
jgi:uncharacterized protein YybS (DUF2232 family)